MSEIKLDVIVETVTALAQMDTFAVSAESLFNSVESSAEEAGRSVGRLSSRISGIPQSAGTLVFAVDNATPALERIRQAVESIPSEKWVTIRTAYDTGNAAQNVAQSAGSGGGSFEAEASFAVGVERVPRDMLAMIHKDEAVLGAEEARAYRENNKSGYLKNGGGAPVQIQNLSIVNVSSPGAGRQTREQLRKNLAPELFRYMRRSGRFGSLGKRREI
ncbi:hypothetical protein MNBD_NITROSPINAE04-862 [hydrothermal vent metagenome]|uniref:Uncharacterized protein n=1 Tax=hydrothermal vent metagenome TaxID=652676 RepID=A0A3B1BR63_9ZZZZ